MKIWLMALPFVWAAHIAMADSIEAEGPADQAATEAVPARAPAHYRLANHRMKRLPSGDIRHCLDRKSSEDIIRCSESRRRK